MASDAVPAEDNLLPPQSREGWRQGLRRRWRSRGRHRELHYWLLFRGLPAVTAYACLYVLGGLVLGWTAVYNVTLGISSPADSTAPALAWLISLAGWLVAPGIAGGVGGYVISKQISSRRKSSIEDLFPESEDE
jgi:hypothetical protein